MDVFVSHETSLVPFPFNPATGVGQSDFENAQVSKLKLHQNSAGVMSGQIAIGSDANYQRFCSGYLTEQGFRHPIYFAAAMHNPDNLDTSANSLMIQEDPGSHNFFNPGVGPAARIWRYDLASETLSVVAAVDQSADTTGARLGAWESSGILNVSDAFGPGAWLVTVQAHTLFVETEQRGPLLFKREGGQLVLLRVPGS